MWKQICRGFFKRLKAKFEIPWSKEVLICNFLCSHPSRSLRKAAVAALVQQGKLNLGLSKEEAKVS